MSEENNAIVLVPRFPLCVKRCHAENMTDTLENTGEIEEF